MAERQFNIIEELNALASEEASASNVDSDIQEGPSIDEHLNTLRTTNWDILNYFRSAYITQSEQIQNLKSELFELDVKIEELQKTRDIYTFQSDSRKNIFSPLPSGSVTRGKSQVIQAQLDELQDVRTALTERVNKLDTELSIIRNHIRALEHSNQCLSSLYQKLPQPEADETVEVSPDIPSTPEEPEEDGAIHGCRILMLNQYDKSQAAERIRTALRQGIENNQNKLEVLEWLIQSDPTRARLTLQELQDSNERLLSAADSLIRELDQDQKQQCPVWMAIDDCVQSYRTLHPDCTIDASVDCTDYDMKVLPIITITLLQLLRELLDNIFYYSNANKILAKIYINSRMIDVYINDNGVGISSDYLTQSPWYSGLHRLHEIIYLLGGKVQIDGDLISGTNVRFSFPVLLAPESSQTEADNNNNQTYNTGKDFDR